MDLGSGFDDSVLAEKRFPTKEDLNQVATEYPIMILPISSYFTVLNSKGLEMLNNTADSKDPIVRLNKRIANSQKPNGVLEELAAIPYNAEKQSLQHLKKPYLNV
jgi:predicted amidohydrolase YtcJ